MAGSREVKRNVGGGAVALAALLVFSVLPPALASGGGNLDQRVRRLIAKHGIPVSRVGVAILLEGDALDVAINADHPFKPASNQKLLTALAGLYWLGPEHEYVTTLSSTAPLQDGEIRGDLILRGTGDPNISGRFYEGDPTAVLRSWARKLREAGLSRVTGKLLGDDSWFDDVTFPPSWDRRQEECWYAAEISALSFNDNCLDIRVKPGSGVGKRAVVQVVPPSPLITIQGAPRTVATGATKVLVHRKHGTNEITVSGQIRLRADPWQGNVTVDDPPSFFASALWQVLRDEGIAVEGGHGKVERTQAGGSDRLTLLVRHTSTLRQDLPIILKRSQNLHAELLLKAMGVRAARRGSVAGGEAAIREFLKRRHIPDEGLVIRDGSGLSEENRVTAGLLVRVLRSAMSEKYFDEFLQALPVAGKDGTLKDRFQRQSRARGNVYAKTGYISGVSCLSGYVVKGRRVACFSVLTNGLAGGTSGAKRLQEEIAELVYEALPEGSRQSTVDSR